VAAWVRAQVRSCGICGAQSGTGAGFLRGLWFPLSIIILPTAPHSSSIIWDWYNRPNCGRRTKWTQSHPTPKNLKKNFPVYSPFCPFKSFTTHILGTCVTQCEFCIETSCFLRADIPWGCLGRYWPQRSSYPLHKYLTCSPSCTCFLLPSSYSCSTSFTCSVPAEQECAYQSNKYHLAHVRLNKRNGAPTNWCKWIWMALACLTLYKGKAEL
jgi:hypothetical protein